MHFDSRKDKLYKRKVSNRMTAYCAIWTMKSNMCLWQRLKNLKSQTFDPLACSLNREYLAVFRRIFFTTVCISPLFRWSWARLLLCNSLRHH